MAKIMAFVAMSPGHLYPFVPLMLELKKRGHEVVFAGQEQGPGDQQVAGMPVKALSLREGEASRPQVATAHGTTLEECAARGEPLAAILERHIAIERPDLLLIDPMLWGAVVAAEASGIPWATVAHNPVTFRGAGVDVRGPGVGPPRNSLSALCYRVLWYAMRMVDDQYLPLINEARATRHLAALSHAWDIDYRPPLILANTAEPFEYPRDDWPAALQFVGPLIWDYPMALPQWIQELDDRPIVLVVGSTVAEANTARRGWASLVLDALAGEDVQVVATLPSEDMPNSLPPNARVERFVPHGALIARATCVVCHGGWGIVQRALAVGVPVVAIPFGYDRFEVARRLEVAKAGCMLAGRHLTQRRARKAVRRALQRHTGAGRVAAAFRDAGGAGRGADAIERLL
jgi:MGT family glycosyltransferase